MFSDGHLGSFGVRPLTDVLVNFISENFSTDTLIILGTSAPGYLVIIPITAFLREILTSVGVRIRETPIDLWLFGLVLVLSWILLLLTWDHWAAWMQSYYEAQEILEKQLEMQMFTAAISGSLMVCALFVAAFRRRRTGRL